MTETEIKTADELVVEGIVKYLTTDYHAQIVGQVVTVSSKEGSDRAKLVQFAEWVVKMYNEGVDRMQYHNSIQESIE
jgi:hypothetical protein